MILRNTAAVLLFCTATLHAQQSTFDADNENWGASGDPVNTTAVWFASGGLPGGHIRVTDAATGGTWYFEAPAKFRGNKCDAYDRYLRWDQYTSDTTNAQQFGGRPDVVLEGAGLTLIFDNAQNPGLAWTHYDLLLRENSGWRISNLAGPAPTEAEFRAVLANVTALRIRGEYRSSADFGGLDNFILESSFRFDLDGDDSSLVFDDGFATDTLCDPYSPVVDVDAVLFSEKPVDSIVLRLLLAPNVPDESLSIIGNLPAALSVLQHTPGWLTLVNTGMATTADFVAGLQAVRYANNAPVPTRGERFVAIRLYGVCGDMGVRYAYLRVFPAGDAGLDSVANLCADGPPANLFQTLGGIPEPGGYWEPALPAGMFDPAMNTPGLYSYIVPGAGTCPGDTATVTVSVEQSFRLQPDTTLCFGDVFLLAVPSGLADWQWSDGSTGAFLDISTPGTYSLSGQTAYCTFRDSLEVAFFTCETCSFYAPNVFSPNDDGRNDTWQIFLPCVWQNFRLLVFDRWGNLVFSAADPGLVWNGKSQGEPVPAGVYIWSLEWTGERYGVFETYRESGGVTVVR
ncbi:MAG: gliding motility-associated C-terminal domain-containing protein [Lewinellaceae bacterium]|nr:gliding motility-associated C-terminal domain-containing protein [Lewinellaceae bacterium]